MISLITAFLLTSSVHAAPQVDIDSIKAMAGCYRVNYDFEETYKTDPKYPISSQPYHHQGLEWISLDYDSGDEIRLQHILITDEGPMKHWSEDWQFNNVQALEYLGDFHWKRVQVIDKPANLWIQKVYQVDDSPQYECAAMWDHSNADGDSWACATPAPLPRREYSVRNDYQILGRGNNLVITKTGWIHQQKNDKIKLKGSKQTLIAKEEGANTYTRLDDAKCADGIQWWNDNKNLWNDILEVWTNVYATHPDLHFKDKINNQTLWMKIGDISDEYAQTSYDKKALQAEVSKVIKQYLK